MATYAIWPLVPYDPCAIWPPVQHGYLYNMATYAMWPPVACPNSDHDVQLHPSARHGCTIPRHLHNFDQRVFPLLTAMGALQGVQAVLDGSLHLRHHAVAQVLWIFGWVHLQFIIGGVEFIQRASDCAVTLFRCVFCFVLWLSFCGYMAVCAI